MQITAMRRLGAWLQMISATKQVLGVLMKSSYMLKAGQNPSAFFCVFYVYVCLPNMELYIEGYYDSSL